MSFLLEPVNSDEQDLNLTNGEWMKLMEIGVGLPIGVCKSINEGKFICTINKPCPICNEGFYVSLKRSTAMGLIAEQLVYIEKDRREIYRGLDSEQKFKANWEPFEGSFVRVLGEFTTFAINSGGFRIY